MIDQLIDFIITYVEQLEFDGIRDRRLKKTLTS